MAFWVCSIGCWSDALPKGGDSGVLPCGSFLASVGFGFPEIDGIAFGSGGTVGRVHQAVLLQLAQQAEDTRKAEPQVAMQLVGGLRSPFLQQGQETPQVLFQQFVRHFLDSTGWRSYPQKLGMVLWER